MSFWNKEPVPPKRKKKKKKRKKKKEITNLVFTFYVVEVWSK